MDELNHGLSVPIVAGNPEGILNVLDPEHRCRRGLEQDDVESAGPVHPMSSSEKLGGQPYESLLLLPMYRMYCASELCGPSRLDLNEHHHAVVLRDEIQLAERRAEVFGDDAVAFPQQIALGLRLSFLPKQTPGVKNCHALVRSMSAAQPQPVAIDLPVQSLQPRARRSVDG